MFQTKTDSNKRNQVNLEGLNNYYEERAWEDHETIAITGEQRTISGVLLGKTISCTETNPRGDEHRFQNPNQRGWDDAEAQGHRLCLFETPGSPALWTLL